MTENIHVLLVAADRSRCSREARVLENAGERLEVAGATSAGGVRTALGETRVDCVVFAENPLTSDGSDLLEVTDLCRDPPGREVPIPVILYTDGSYGASTAKATEGVTDYVCSDGANSVAHLVDRIRWATAPDDDQAFDQRLVESIDDGVFVFDESGRIRYANEAMEAVLETPAGEFVGRTVDVLAESGLVGAADADAVGAAVESAVAGETEGMTPEVSVETPDGETRLVEFNVVGFPGDEEGALATVHNVTEYRRAESALAETKTKIERLHGVTDEMGACRSERELFELAVDAADRVLDADVCGIDTVEDGEFVPQATVGEYGATPVEGVGGRALRAGESILVEDAGPADAPVEGARSVLAVPVENVALFRAVAHEPGRFDERDRQLAELLVAHVAETLTRIRVGETLRRREQDLLAERERLVALFEHVPHPVVGYAVEDGEAVIRDLNPSFESTFGVSADAAVGDALDEHVDAGGDLLERLGGDETVERTVTRSTADGDRDFLVTAGPLDGLNGEGYIVYTDITEQAERERVLERERDRLDEFAQIAASDLREQLNEARGYLELATETDDPEHVAQVRRAHESMRRLLDDMRYLSEGDTDEFDTGPVGLEDTATTAWASVETGAANLSVEDGTVEADPERLLKLLEQLVRNAVDHGAPDDDPLLGGIDDSSSLTVRVGPLEDGGFYVEDTGTGIPPGERDRVFESGVTTRDDRPGLGLQVVDRIADAHGWSVEVRESEEGGARFEVHTEPAWIATAPTLSESS